MNRRALAAAGIVVLWLAGIAALARRELFSGEGARLARAALFIAPGADYYAILDGDHQVGFASSTIDTTTTSILITDLVAADVGDTAAPRRLTARAYVTLTRTLRLVRFLYELGYAPGENGSAAPRYRAIGTMNGDTLLRLAVTTDGQPAQRRSIHLPGPLLLPTMVPMAMALADQPKVGHRYSYEVFDPLTDSVSHVTLRVRAESLFVLPDSATFDAHAGRWVAAHRDTVRAWRIEQAGGGVLTGWIDGSGRMVQAAPVPRILMRRTAFELAFENWSHARSPMADHSSMR